MTDTNQKLKAVPPALKSPKVQQKESRTKSLGIVLLLLSLLIGFGVVTHELYQRHDESLIFHGKSMRQEIQQLREAIQSDSAQQVIMLKILVLKPSTEIGLAREISEVLHFQSRAYREDPDLALAIMDHESDFVPTARSHKSAIGLMQVRKHWADVHGDEDLFDITTNIRRALYILKIYRLTYKELPVVLSAYNRGQNPVDADIINGCSTDNQYVRDVLKTYERLKALN